MARCTLSVLRPMFARISFERDGVVLRVPAVVIGDQSERSVAEFRFTGEFGFGHAGHPDHIESQLAVGVRFGEG